MVPDGFDLGVGILGSFQNRNDSELGRGLC